MRTKSKTGVFLFVILLFAGAATAQEVINFRGGLTLTYAIENGDSSGLGYDYENTNVIESLADGSITIDWSMGEPFNTQGSRTVLEGALNSAMKSDDWYSDGESGVRDGTVSLFLSRAAFAEVKAGEAIDWTQVGLGTIEVKHRFRRAGFTPYTVIIDDDVTEIPAIILENKDGKQWLYLDNREHPLLLEWSGETEFDTSLKLLRIETRQSQEAIKSALERDGSLIAHGIRFKTDSTEIVSESESSLTAVIDYLQNHGSSRLRIEGHTDSEADDAYNQRLSEGRAAAVAEYFVREGDISPERFVTVGHGESQPIADNNTIEGRAANRRVVLTVIDLASSDVEQTIAANTTASQESNTYSSELLFKSEKRVSEDHPLLPRYPNSEMIGFDQRAYDQVVVFSKSDGKWIAESPEGKMTWIAYRGPNDTTPSDIISSYAAELQDAGFEVLFSCQNADCGPDFIKTLVSTKSRYISPLGDRFTPQSGRYIAAKKEGGLWATILVYDYPDGPSIVRQEIIENGTSREVTVLDRTEIGSYTSSELENVSIPTGTIQGEQFSNLFSSSGRLEWNAYKYDKSVSEREAFVSLVEQANQDGFEVESVCTGLSCGPVFIEKFIQLNGITSELSEIGEYWKNSGLYAVGTYEQRDEAKRLGILTYKQSDGLAISHSLMVSSDTVNLDEFENVDESKNVDKQLDPIRVQLRKFVDFAEESADRIPKYRLDFDAVLAEVGKDPVSLANWVRTNTFMLPYRGALKGAFGTLMELRGNSLDRSLLLAELLARAGHQTQLLHVVLNKDGLQAAKEIFYEERAKQARFLSTISPTKKPNSDQLMQQVITLTGADPDTIQNVLAQQLTAKRELDALLKEAKEQASILIAKSGIDDQAGIRTLNLALNDLEDHWWISVRIGGEIIEYDLVFDTEESSLAEQRYTSQQAEKLSSAEAIQQYGHTVTLRVLVHQQEPSGKAATHVALEHSMPTAEQGLESFWLRYESLGDDVNAQIVSGDDISRTLANQNEWLPQILTGGKTISKFSIRSDGSVNETPTQNRPVTKLASDVNSAFGRAGAAISGIPTTIGSPAVPSKSNTNPTSESKSQLVGVSLEVSISNTVETGREVRKLFDLSKHTSELQDNQLVQVQRARYFLTQQQFQIQSHDIAFEYLFEKMRNQSIKGATAIGKMLNQIALSNNDAVRKLMNELNRPDTLISALGMLRQSLNSQEIAITQPNLLSEFFEITESSKDIKVQHGIDIIRNDVLALDGDIRQAIRQGVFDTLLESYLINNGDSEVNAAVQFRRDLDANNAAYWAVHTNEQPQYFEIMEPLGFYSNFCVLISPTLTEPNNERASGFWLLNPSTGRTLGYSEDGRGADFVEKSILTANAISTGYSFYQFVSCATDWAVFGATDCEKVACVAGGVWNFLSMGITSSILKHGLANNFPNYPMTFVRHTFTDTDVDVAFLGFLINLGGFGATGVMNLACNVVDHQTTPIEDAPPIQPPIELSPPLKDAQDLIPPGEVSGGHMPPNDDEFTDYGSSEEEDPSDSGSSEEDDLTDYGSSEEEDLTDYSSSEDDDPRN